MDSETNAPEVRVDFALQIGKGQLQVSAQVPADRVNLVQLQPAIKQVSSNIIGAVVETVENEGFQVSCRAGCGACCRQLVPITFFEAEELADWVLSLPPEQQVALEERFNAALARLKDLGVLDRFAFWEVPEGSNPKAIAMATEYFHAGVPCPFLQDESCSIHPIRPLICREYLVTSPAEFCANPRQETVRGVPMPIKLSSALISLGAQITPEERGWLPLTLLFVWIRSGLKVTRAYEGTGPELLQLVVERAVAAENAWAARLAAQS